MSTKNNSFLLDYLAGFCLLSVIPAFYLWNNSVLSGIVLILLGILLVVDLSKFGIAKKKLGLTCVMFCLYLIYILRSDASIVGAVVTIIIVLFFIIRSFRIIEIYEKYTNILAVALSISLLVFIYVIYIGGDLPHILITPKNYAKTDSYFLYPLLIVTSNDLFIYPRFFGLFDEPGVVGTICGIILMGEDFNLKKKKNIVFLLSGIASLSLFFFIIILSFLLLRASKKAVLGSVIIAIIIGFSLKDNDYFNALVLDRFHSENSMVADNRTTSEFDSFYDSFKKSSDLWLGLGNGVGHSHNEGGCSYKEIVVDYGLIYFILYMLCFFIYAGSELGVSKKFVVFVILTLGTMYQRPFIGQYTYIFLIIASIYNLKKNIN